LADHHARSQPERTRRRDRRPTKIYELRDNLVGEGVLGEILDAWFATAASAEPADRANVEHVAELDDGRRPR
jgi:hypothetical protein